MKSINILTCRMALMLSVFVLAFSACKKQDDLRTHQEVEVVGVKINNELFLPTNVDNTVQVLIPGGRDLSNLKVQLIIANGDAVNFVDNESYDLRKPIQLKLKGEDGQDREVTLKVQSPPVLTSFIVEGLTVLKEDIHLSANSLIVQVPPETDLTNLKVTMEFINGTLIDFQNGVSADYTTQKSFKVKGVDEETVYSYSFVITTEEIGPASINEMTINGIATDSVVMSAPGILVPYVKGLTDFSKSTVTLVTGFGNQVDPAFTGKDLNLLSGTVKVKVTGSDGIEKEFTITRPQLSLKPLFSKKYSDFGFGANDMAGVAFSGNHIVVANYSAVGTTVIGPNYYDLTGNQEGVLSKTGVQIAHSLRKLASDGKGAMLVVPLGITANVDQIVYKWDNVTATPVPYITYTKESLGLSYTPRSAGINISGNLDGDAIITIGMAQKTDVFIWKVIAGVLNPIPQLLTLPYGGTSYYWSVEPMPIGTTTGFVGALIGNNTFTGIISMNNTMVELHKQSGIVASDCRITAYKGRVYLAYTAYVSGKGAFMRICDITDGQADSYANPIFNVLMPSTEPNANITMDVDMAVINDKLHAVFACTNIGMELFNLEN